jgi:hypothetical protein
MVVFHLTGTSVGIVAAAVAVVVAVVVVWKFYCHCAR